MTKISEKKTEKPQEIFLSEYKPANFSIPKVDLKFDIFDEHTIVTNTSEFVQNSGRKISAPTQLQLNGDNLELLSVTINNTKISEKNYKISEDFLLIENILDFGETFTLKTVVKIFPDKNKQLMGLYMSDGMYCTQNEPEGFRNITYHLDRPDVMSMYTTTIIADQKKFPVMLSNGNNTYSETLKNGRHLKKWNDPFTKPCYLFALVAGDLAVTEDEFITMSGRKIPLQIFTDPKNKTRVDHAMKSLKKAMKWDEQRFGREYDLDIFMIVAVDNFNSGAMENKGLNIFNSSAILCDQESATDRDFQFIEAVVAHEYFHNWTGNRITCRDWFQLTLKEGLTVFRDAEFSADMGDAVLKRIDDATYMREGQFAEDAGPMAHPIQPQSFIQIENFYTQTVYEKGAEVIRMLQTMYGKENFRKALDFYFENFDGKAVTIHEFLYSFEKTLNIDLTQFKKSWYFQAGTPLVKISDQYFPEKNEYHLTVEQENPVGKKQVETQNLASLQKQQYTHYHFPLAYGILNPKTGEELSAGTLEITKQSETFVFKNIPEPPLPSLLRHFSAPVKVEYEYTLDEDIFLFENDTDLFNKYESGQRVARRMIQEIMNQDTNASRIKESEFFDTMQKIILAYEKILTDPNISDGLKAELISLPGLFSIVEADKVYDYPNAYDSKMLYKEIIANALEDIFLDIYQEKTPSAHISQEERNTLNEIFSLSPESIGERALKNTCLGFITAMYDKEAQEEDETEESEKNIQISQMAFDHFQKANTMTDTLASLAVLCQIKSPEKNIALASFKNKWKNDALVMNKWFAIQASSPSIRGEEIQKLEKEKSFDPQNPNKIRALYGSFGRNKAVFHDPEFAEKNYKYLRKKILEIDCFNNKLSSGLAHVFDEYAKLPEKNQALIKTELKNILDKKISGKISDALFEVVSKILESVQA